MFFHFKRQWGKTGTEGRGEEGGAWRQKEKSEAVTDWQRGSGKGQKALQGAIVSHKELQSRTCFTVTHTHVTAEHVHTHGLTHSIKLTSTLRPFDAQACMPLPAGRDMASDWTQVANFANTQRHSVHTVCALNTENTHTHTKTGTHRALTHIHKPSRQVLVSFTGQLSYLSPPCIYFLILPSSSFPKPGWLLLQVIPSFSFHLFLSSVITVFVSSCCIWQRKARWHESLTKRS